MKYFMHWYETSNGTWRLHLYDEKEAMGGCQRIMLSLCGPYGGFLNEHCDTVEKLPVDMSQRKFICKNCLRVYESRVQKEGNKGDDKV